MAFLAFFGFWSHEGCFFLTVSFSFLWENLIRDEDVGLLPSDASKNTFLVEPPSIFPHHMLARSYITTIHSLLKIRHNERENVRDGGGG